jgi:ATP-binding cassette subfamily B multidrug efflux pump
MADRSVSGKALDWPVIQRIFSLVRPYRTVFRISVVLTLLLALLSPVRPWLIQFTIDNFISKGNYNGLLWMTILLLSLLIFQSIVQYFNTFLTNRIGQLVVRDMRINLFRHITGFRLKFFDKTPIGTLITRTISDLETIADIFSEGLIVIIGDLLQLLFIVIFMFVIDWRLALISLSTVPFLLMATSVFKNGIKEAFREVRTEVAALNTFVQEHITGMSVVQIFNREEEEYKRFQKINKRHMKAHIKSVWYYSIFYPVVELLTAVSIGLLVWWGSKAVLVHQVSVGNVIAFIMYINMLFRPIRELADKFNTLQMGMVSSERVLRLLDTNEQISSTENRSADAIQGEINFRDVWFSYKDKSYNDADPEWILKGLSFHVPQGTSLALVGATGSGKSSIANLICRLYEYQEGQITIDNTEIRAFDSSSLRSHISMVLQDVFLFSDSIANNISLKDPSISREQIIAASKAVGAHTFIEKLPGGYDYNVMERGATLSTGQRQLIAFIRAYVFNPKILILDEATSSIDSETEELIRVATEKLTEGRTSVIIAHRLSTIQKCDKILVLDHGQKMEEGTHHELLTLNKSYKKLFDAQFSAEKSV